MAPPNQRPDRARERRETSIGWRMAGIGMQTSSEVIAGALLGWAADRWLETSPRWTLVGAVAGIAVGLTTLIRGAMKANKELDDARRNRL
jgi:F0F1-type ATP synthase assembly protein I